MSKHTRASIGLLAALLVVLAVTHLLQLRRPPAAAPAFSIQDVLAIPDSSEFKRVLGPEPILFPRDHCPHPDYRSEWWYLTGHLRSEKGEEFGFQFTLFRNGMTARPAGRASAWAVTQVYMAHFALTDVSRRKFHAFEHFSRGEPGLAGAAADPWHFWLGSWQVVQTGSNPLTLRLEAAEGPVTLDLRLENRKPVVLQGDQGFSRKGAEPGQASFYYSLTRLGVSGLIHIDGRGIAVTGQAWMDREWGTTQLAAHLAGWDWFSLQLDDGREIMYYQLRQHDGSADTLSRGVVVDADGCTTPLTPVETSLEVTQWWTSPAGRRYPGRWRMTLPGAGIQLEIEPVLADQEWDRSIRYWEGAVRVQGWQNAAALAIHPSGKTAERGPGSGDGIDQPLAGRGYIELTGY